METYKYEDLKIGQKASFTRVVAPEDVDKFRDLTEDINSLHSDEAYAEKTKFRKQVVYGLLIQSFLSKLAGVYLPGKYCLILSIQTNFKKPCFVGDILTISGEIIQKYDSTNMIILKTNITNDKGESVMGGGDENQIIKMKTAIVLGASGGLGKAIVEMLLTEKFEIIGTYHLNKPRENLFDKTILTHLDISDKSSIDEFCDKIKDKKIDFFVNTIANSLNFKNFNKIEVEDYESDIRINLLNYIYLLKKIINQFNPKSNIVFILTKAVIGTSPRAFSSYVVSKYALLGFMKSLSVELKDIKVNAISPGMMDTKFVPDFLKKMSPNLVNPKDVAKEIKKIISGGNTGQNILV